VSAAAPGDGELREPPQVSDLARSSLALASDAGLVMVETRQETLGSAEPDSPERPRQKRVRPPRTALPEEPLQLVETHKDATPPGE
jgi:hypothetical protein